MKRSERPRLAPPAAPGQRAWVADLRAAHGGPQPWALIRAAVSPALDLGPVERIALIALARHSNIGGWAWPSAALVAKEIGCSERRARQAFARLAETELVHVTHRVGRSLVFEIDAAVVERYARTPADSAATPADSAATPADSADEVVALRSSLIEVGCAERTAPPEAKAAEELLAATRRAVPATFTAVIDAIEQAYQKSRDVALLQAALRRLDREAEATTQVAANAVR